MCNMRGGWNYFVSPIPLPSARKSLLIGCGGGFQQECSQQFSPVADWMGGVDLFLEDDGQQYGNMEEAATVAKTPATCQEVWSGDHRQTPGRLKKSKEAKHLGRNSLNVRWLFVVKLSMSKLMIS